MARCKQIKSSKANDFGKLSLLYKIVAKAASNSHVSISTHNFLKNTPLINAAAIMLSYKSLYLLLFLLPVCLMGQNDLRLKWEPKFVLSANINERWGYKFQAGGLEFLENISQKKEVQQTERLDARGFISYSFPKKRKLTMGYMYRQTEPFKESSGYEHRLSLTYSFKNPISTWYLGHRFMSEYRIRNSSNQTRFRYRLSGHVPLQGAEIDAGEFYFMAGNELVLSLDSQITSLENRFSFNFGRQMSKSLKLEIGAEYRFRGSEVPDAVHFLSSLYYKL